MDVVSVLLVLTVGAYAWLGFFLVTRTAIHLDRGVKPTPRNILDSLLRQPTRAGLYVSTTAGLVPVYLLNPAPEPLLFGAAMWAIFSLTLRRDGLAHRWRRQIALGLLVFSVALAIVTGPLGVQGPVQAVSIVWLVILVSGACFNFYLSRIFGRSVLIVSTLSAVLGTANVIPHPSLFPAGDVALSSSGYLLLLVAWALFVYSLLWHHTVPPLHEPKRRRDLRRSFAYILPLSLAYGVVAGVGLQVGLVPAIALILTVTFTHSLLDAIWSLRTLAEETREADFARDLEELHSYYLASEQELRDDVEFFLHQDIIPAISKAQTAIKSPASNHGIPQLKILLVEAEETARDGLYVFAHFQEDVRKKGIFGAINSLRFTRFAKSIQGAPESIDISSMAGIATANFEPNVPQEIVRFVREGLTNVERHCEGRCYRVEIGADLNSPGLYIWVRSFQRPASAELRRGPSVQAAATALRPLARGTSAIGATLTRVWEWLTLLRGRPEQGDAAPQATDARPHGIARLNARFEKLGGGWVTGKWVRPLEVWELKGYLPRASRMSATGAASGG